MQKGGSQYGVPPPEMATFGGASVTRPPMVGSIPPVEASSPRSVPAPRQSNFEELAATVTRSYQEEDPLLPGGEEVERGISGNRWPRQETLELLKIRSDMDAAFRDATLKGPLWEEVSRKLAEQGYTRSSKKCKEKFENVHKYYKRTKDSRASRPDGKSYRFFSQLEALHNASSSSVPPAASTIATNTITATASSQPALAIAGGARIHQPTPISSIPPALPSSVPPTIQPMDSTAAAAAAGLSALGGGMSFSSNTSDSESETEDENTEEGAREKRKRKREGSGGDGGGRGGRGGGSKKMMAFFEGLMKQVIERQEAMQHKFLETIEKREQDRMIREEAWRRQEMARLNREQEAMAQERAKAASRDATIISFLQKITGQAVHVPQTAPVQPTPTSQPIAVVQNAQAAVPQPPSLTPPPPQPPQSQHPNQQQTPPQSQPLQPQQQQQPPQSQPHIHPQQQQQQPPPPPPTQPQYTLPPRQLPQPESGAKTASMEIALPARQELLQLQFPQEPEIAAQAMVVASNTSDIASSRWPKAEVHALINIRAGMESKYQEAVPKGPLWEEISTSMKQLGFNRNAKRCKEKWENINKYFKKVKESNKKRPDDAKTCPYFHQLDALYRNKVLGGGGGGGRVGGVLAITGSSSGSGDGRSQQQDPDPSVLPITTLPPPISNSTTGDGNSNKPVVSPKATSTEVATVAAPAAATQAPSSNGGLPPPTSFVQDKANATTDLMKKPEDIVKEFMEQRQNPRFDYDGMAENTEDDDVDDDEDDDDDDDGMDEEEQKMAYKIEFQRPSIPPSTTPTSNVNGNKATASTTGSFLAMVHQ